MEGSCTLRGKGSWEESNLESSEFTKKKKTIVGYKWVFIVKYNSNSSIKIYKAQLVEKDCT